MTSHELRRAAAGAEGPTGGWIVDKPAGPTSHDLVAGARRALATRRVGHAGTLDPEATGVLVVLVGEATKLAPYATGHTKEYVVRIRFGVGTDTLDAAGRVVATRELAASFLSEVDLGGAIAAERGRTAQLPPDFSAVSVGGVRAHRAARAGERLQLTARPISLERLELVAIDGLELDLRLTVSKGYYVRALARDLGERLGAPAHVASLRRIASGPFRVEEAISWPPAGPPPLIPLGRLAALALPVAVLTEPAVARARAGQRLTPAEFVEPPADGTAAWFGASGELVAIGERVGDLCRVVRGFSAGGGVPR